MNWRALIKVIAFTAIAGVMAAMEIGTLTGPHVGNTHTYYAMFGGTDGVSGLRDGNQVKAAGVPIGKVDSVDIVDATHARVTFSVNDNQRSTTTSWAVVRYANLIGQRYLAITQAGATPGRPLPYGSTIPMNRTEPALSLTALFNGFRPLFSALTPQQVNELSQDVIDILQGQTDRVGDLVAKTASLTTNLAARDTTFSQILDSLTTLLSTVARHDDQLAGLLTSLRSLTATLHADGPALMGSLDSVDGLIGSVGDLLAKLEDHNLPADVADLEHITGVVAGNTATLDRLITSFNLAFTDFTRVSQNGSFANAYICTIVAKTVGTPYVTGSQIVKAVANGLHLNITQVTNLLKSLGLVQLVLNQNVLVPMKLPNGVAAASGHTRVCR
jgi:phospholipid/cholesterol/gamma-HCH transport system substrate-binding protein